LLPEVPFVPVEPRCPLEPEDPEEPLEPDVPDVPVPPMASQTFASNFCITVCRLSLVLIPVHTRLAPS
jgi:hypothetical protein